MSGTATVRARVESSLKADVEKLFRQLGITTTQAVTMFYSQIRLRRGFPFPVEIPNEGTRNTFSTTDKGEELNSYTSLDAMFKSLNKC